jgi:hypothetical protein
MSFENSIDSNHSAGFGFNIAVGLAARTRFVFRYGTHSRPTGASPSPGRSAGIQHLPHSPIKM